MVKNIHKYILLIAVGFLSGCITQTASKTSQTGVVQNSQFGAIALSQKTLRWQMRWNVANQSRAEKLALDKCATEDCKIILTFGPKQCGTFSLGDKGFVGVGIGDTALRAKDNALESCQKSGQFCKVATPRCNGNT